MMNVLKVETVVEALNIHVENLVRPNLISIPNIIIQSFIIYLIIYTILRAT